MTFLPEHRGIRVRSGRLVPSCPAICNGPDCRFEAKAVRMCGRARAGEFAPRIPQIRSANRPQRSLEFVMKTRSRAGDGCGHGSFERRQSTGFATRDRRQAKARFGASRSSSSVSRHMPSSFMPSRDQAKIPPGPSSCFGDEFARRIRSCQLSFAVLAEFAAARKSPRASPSCLYSLGSRLKEKTVRMG